MKQRTLYSTYAAAVIALSSAAFLPAEAVAQVGVNLVIGNAPPPARFEAAPQARRGYVWAPGYWDWNGRRHDWVAGHWEAERNGLQFERAQWVRDNNGWRLDRGGWRPGQVRPAGYDYVQVAPPQMRHERMPRPRQGYLWSPGHWEWRGQRHHWVEGVWIAERPGYAYSPATWIQRDGRWYMEQSRWTPRGGHDGRPDGRPHGGGRGDSDHDGIPNRYDHDRDNDGVPNRNDRDRDGDGVPNHRDQQPDNPRRD